MCACSLTQNAARLVRALMDELPGAAVRAAADIVSCVSPVSLTDAAAAPARPNQLRRESAHGRSDVLVTAAAATGAAPTAADVQGSEAATPAAVSARQLSNEASMASDAAAAGSCGAAAASGGSRGGGSGGGRDSTAGAEGLAAAGSCEGPAGAACHGACQVLMSHNLSECDSHHVHWTASGNSNKPRRQPKGDCAIAGHAGSKHAAPQKGSSTCIDSGAAAAVASLTLGVLPSSLGDQYRMIACPVMFSTSAAHPLHCSLLTLCTFTCRRVRAAISSGKMKGAQARPLLQIFIGSAFISSIPNRDSFLPALPPGNLQLGLQINNYYIGICHQLITNIIYRLSAPTAGSRLHEPAGGRNSTNDMKFIEQLFSSAACHPRTLCDE